MKIIYTGAEYHLSSFLNCLKVPLLLILIISVIYSIIYASDNDVSLKETLVGKHWKFFAALSAFTSAYMFLIWK